MKKENKKVLAGIITVILAACVVVIFINRNISDKKTLKDEKEVSKEVAVTADPEGNVKEPEITTGDIAVTSTPDGQENSSGKSTEEKVYISNGNGTKTYTQEEAEQLEKQLKPNHKTDE